MDVFGIKFNISLCKMDSMRKKKWIFQIQFYGQNAKFHVSKNVHFPDR